MDQKHKKRVVVTGMGIVSCFGTDVDQFYKELLAGKSGIVPIEEFPCQDYPTRFAGVIRNFDPGEYIDKKQARRIDPFIRYTMVAGKKALEHGGLVGPALEKLDKSRCGILIGSGMGGMTAFSDGIEALIKQSFKRISPFFVPYIITNMGGALLAIDLGFMGPNYSISTACATANYSIVAAAQHIQQGHADVMLCGGAEAPISPIGVAGFVACKALSERNDAPEKASRPWDRGRDGFVIGEGSGVLLLESLEHAVARGATILAEYVGGYLNCDANHITSPREDGSGVSECMEGAIRDAGIAKQDINYVNCHGTSTPVGDMCEIRALRKVFGDQMSRVKINSTKSMVGHCLGAAGGIEAIATIQAILTGMLHPTINVEDPEPELGDIDIVPNVAKAHPVTAAISNSFGFGGHNSSIIFAPYRAS
ncbi:MAG: beta-ketoacyl-ACP synthase II [Verrucomicrobia bacterium]|nr:beta-ketoacyl-ACP synthase II [Verrucomicrobiota bacterium]